MGPMIALRETEGGTVLPVRAVARARRNQLAGQHHGMLKVCVTHPGEKGKANKAIVELLASALALRKSHITLLSGVATHDKRFLIAGVSAAELRARINALLGAQNNGD
jgi:uncharacterized protein YggU (UPF0235/DUF167 family)